MPERKKLQSAALVFFFLATFTLFSSSVFADDTIKAPQFTAIGVDGKNFSLADFAGSPLILHITNIEIPLCVECEESLKGQVEELAKLKAAHPEVQIATINMRKNSYSRDGLSLAEKWWKVNIT
ncbi:MAG: cytochrome c biogenesis protein, partial [Methanothrix sp.]